MASRPSALGSLNGTHNSPRKQETWGSASYGPAAGKSLGPGETLGDPMATKTRLANLSNKLNDLDVDLAKSSRAKQSYKGMMDGMQMDVLQYSKAQSKLQISLVEAEERVQRLENALGAERSAREMFGKNLQRLLDERVMKMTQMLEQEETERAREMDALRARLRFMEERNKQLELELQDNGKQVTLITKATLPKLTGHVDTLMKTVEQDKLRGGGTDGDMARKFQVSIANLETDLHEERTAHERDNEAHRQAIKTEMANLKRMVETEQKEREAMQERTLDPVWTELRKVKLDFEKETMDREHDVAENAQGLMEKLNHVKTGLEKAAIGIDEQQNHRLKELDDKLWHLSTQFEQEVMERQRTFTELESKLGAEKEDRKASEEQVLTIMESLSDKIRLGLEED